MILRFVIFCTFLPISILSQEFSKLDFYRTESRKNNTDKKQFELQQKLIDIYRIYNPDSCYFYTQKNLQLIKKKNWQAEKGKTLLGLVNYFVEKNKISEGLKINKTSFLLNQKNNYNLADNYYLFGRLFHQKGEHKDAVNNYLKAVDFGNKSNNLWTVSAAYRSLAFIYLDESNKEKSYENINEALKTAEKSNSKEALGFCYGVLAEIERSFGKVKEAANHFKTSYEYFKATQNDYGQAWLYTNWSLLDIAKLMESYEMQLKAQEIWNKISPNHYMSVVNHYNMAYSYMDFYKYYDKYKDQLTYEKSELLPKAQEEFEISKNVAEENNNMQWVMFSYAGMAELSKTRKDIDSYSKNLTQYYATRDSIYSQKRKNEIAKIESQKVVNQKNKEIALNKIIIKNKEQEKIYYLLGLAALFVIGILLFFLYRQLKKNSSRLQSLNQELEKANKNKMRFFGILNHDLRSPVVSLIHFLNLQKDAPELMDDETKIRLEKQTSDSADQLLTQMEDLLLWSKGQMENFEPNKQFYGADEVFDEVKKEFVWVSNIHLEFEIPTNLKIFTDKEYLKTILRNLINNAVKVLQNVNRPHIVCKVWEQGDFHYILIKDNGGGTNIEKFRALYDDKMSIGTTKGLGMHVIRDLCKAIDCKIEVDTNVEVGETRIMLCIKKV
ncbi:HAMP domain-containing histidine kinase [Epilithonimonas sp. JDS]|uniref:tetratricopeptide repeat-containing sensor histidine kinase n=1 Tax=Epilithonimonas sp. JDS TaxID=2902797 RepID=UPI001E371DB0|nr:tetratricopeptide repeat-containing sensor histidine kinase [Epilithonimonas sp. JDS]MCD9853722.1 HAMP domain-containing histidine kinase [Epilithonimonas sp. JDS]